MLARADYLLNIAPESLKDVAIEDYDSTTDKRLIQRVPHGVVLVVSWLHALAVDIPHEPARSLHGISLS